MTPRDKLRAGLIFLDAAEFDAAGVAEGLALAIRDESYQVSAVAAPSDHEAEIRANGLTLRLALFQPRPAGDSTARDSFLHMPRISADDEDDFDFARAILVLSVVLPDSATAMTRGDARRLLAWSTYLMAEALAADFVQWRQPPEEFSVDLFLEDLVQHHVREPAVAPELVLHGEILHPEMAAELQPEISLDLPPKRRKAEQLPPLADCEDALLDQVFADNMCVPAEAVVTRGSRDRMRLATWLLSLSIALFSLPIAGALFVMHLLRGENLRTASRAMAVVGILMVANKSGMPMPGKDFLDF